MRSKLTEVAGKVVSIGSLSLPEKGVNRIAAEIYEKIDSLTSKYADVEETSA